MKIRLPNARACVVLFACLSATACFRSVDGTKVQCSDTDHCPSNFICAGGHCISRPTSTVDVRPVDGVALADSRMADSDETGRRTDVAPTGADVPAAPDGAPADLAPDASPSDTSDAPLSGTGGVGGVGAGGAPSAGGATASGGQAGSSGGASGSGGLIGAGGTGARGGVVANGGLVSSGGLSGNGGALGFGGILAAGGSGSGGMATSGGATGGTAMGGGGASGTGGATTSVNYCSPTPCVHGTCTSQASGYSCTCTTGWQGTNCDQQINYCASSPCVHGTCSNSTSGYSCTCTAGWQGTNCDQQVNYCASNPCVHGTCTNSTSGYSCTCAAGWQGTNCDQQINYCASSPCVHGTCSNGTTAYTCSCAAGWNGGTCSSAIKPTVSGPADVTMCSGGATDTATFTVAASGGAGGPYSYQWYQASDLNNSNPTALGNTSSSMQINIGGRIPMAPGKYYYYVVVADTTNGGTSQSRTATLWIPNPPYYNIPHWGVSSSDLWVEIDAPASGCIYYSYSGDNSSFTSYQAVCAGTGVQKIDVGTPDYTTPNNNVVRTINMEGASGYACETISTWYWDGASQ